MDSNLELHACEATVLSPALLSLLALIYIITLLRKAAKSKLRLQKICAPVYMNFRCTRPEVTSGLVRLKSICTEAPWYEWYILPSRGWLLPLGGLLIKFRLAVMVKRTIDWAETRLTDSAKAWLHRVNWKVGWHLDRGIRYLSAVVWMVIP